MSESRFLRFDLPAHLIHIIVDLLLRWITDKVLRRLTGDGLVG